MRTQDLGFCADGKERGKAEVSRREWRHEKRMPGGGGRLHWHWLSPRRWPCMAFSFITRNLSTY